MSPNSRGLEESGRINKPKVGGADAKKKKVVADTKKGGNTVSHSSNIKGVDSQLAQTILDQIVEL